MRPWYEGRRFEPGRHGPADKSILDARMGYVDDAAPGAARRERYWQPGQDVDRRARKRRGASLILRDDERQRLRHARRKTALCASSWMRLRRIDGGVEREMLMPRRCGRRSCPHCGEVAQSYHLMRLADDWKGFLTLTVPPDRDPADWWRDQAGLMTRFIRWLRDEVRSGQAEVTDYDETGQPRLRYAWNVESQTDSCLPHWHILSNVVRVDYTRVREAWMRIARVTEAWIHWSPIVNRVQAIRYVSLYCSKERLSDVILAIIGPKRQWSCEGCRPPDEASGWKVDATLSPEAARSAVEAAAAGEPRPGWTLEWASDRAGASWSRRVEDGAASVDARDLAGQAAWLEEWGVSDGADSVEVS